MIYFPEFLRERRWLQDALAGEWVIGCNTDARAVMSPWCANNKAHYVSLVEAEIVKMMANCYAAMNVVFANHVYELSQKMKADYGAVQAAHDRIRHRDQNYLSVTSELRGFGGKCLPKDLDFLIDTFARFGLQQDLFNSIRQDNRLWPTTVRQDT